jgi:hypothetical protein
MPSLLRPALRRGFLGLANNSDDSSTPPPHPRTKSATAADDNDSSKEHARKLSLGWSKTGGSGSGPGGDLVGIVEPYYLDEDGDGDEPGAVLGRHEAAESSSSLVRTGFAASSAAAALQSRAGLRENVAVWQREDESSSSSSEMFARGGVDRERCVCVCVYSIVSFALLCYLPRCREE